MGKAYGVTFIDPDTRKTRVGQVEDGASILDAAHRAGEEVSATCGSRGRCRSCRVKIISGNVPPPTIQDGIQLGHEEVQEGFRLACQTKVIGECEVMALPPRAEAGHQILAGDELDADRVTLDSGVVKHVVTANAPKEEHHQTSDTEEILATLPPDTSRDIPLMVLRRIPALLRAKGGALTVTTFNDRIVDIEAGDTSEHRYGMAFDIGTTSIVGNLIDLASGEQLASVGSVNPQAVYGGDLMSRIAFAQFDEKKLTTLRAKALNAINDFVSEACDKAGIDSNHIYKIVVVGNTCMHHVLLGIDVSYVGLAPYAPSVREPLVIPARDLPLKSAPHAHICLLPIVAGFVGADTMACVLATRIYESDEIRALVDIGTNGEVVMGSKGRLMACSAPAGPALEGAQIRHGMRGAAGAIEKVEIGEDVELSTVGDVPAIGICGSGLIDACAKMLDAGVLDASGLLRRDRNNEMPEALGRRTVANDQGREFVLAWSEQAGKDENITLTQGDIRQFQLAKSAIYSGIVMLQQVMDVSDEALSELMLCGGFGNYINIASAVNVRLLPELSQEKITYVGNAAALGAQMALLSETERNRAWELAQTIEHVALAASPDFQTIFIDGMSFGDDADAGRKNEKTGSRRKKAAGAGG
jgi:uncharacterized 2Fe-2S/4Fe-4S cluster protein (DUF4445 family)